jgi:hypothetical protein
VSSRILFKILNFFSYLIIHYRNLSRKNLIFQQKLVAGKMIIQKSNIFCERDSYKIIILYAHKFFDKISNSLIGMIKKIVLENNNNISMKVKK